MKMKKVVTNRVSETAMAFTEIKKNNVLCSSKNDVGSLSLVDGNFFHIFSLTSNFCIYLLLFCLIVMQFFLKFDSGYFLKVFFRNIFGGERENSNIGRFLT